MGILVNYFGRTCLFTIAAMGMFAVLTSPVMAVQAYRATPLGTLGGTQALAQGMSDGGWVVGTSTVPNFGEQSRAFLYCCGVMKDLGTLGGLSSGAAGINSNGRVVGGASLYGNATSHAFLYQSGAMSDLGTLGGPNSYAQAINDFDKIVGASDIAGAAARHAFLYFEGTMTDLGTLGGADSSANAINVLGQITGAASTADGDLHAFLYAAGVMSDLGTLGGHFSEGNAINTSGQITGRTDIMWDSPVYHAFLYSAGKMQDIGTLGGQSSSGMGINGPGDIVGASNTVDGANHAYLYTNGTMYDLNTLVVSGLGGQTLTEARAINNSGQIIANSCNPVRGCSSYLLDPIPGTATVKPQVGLWWNPSESGSGYSIDFRHDVLVVLIYSYATNGDPLWYIASGPLSGSVVKDTFTGQLDKYRGGQCISCSYAGVPQWSGSDGSITIKFQSDTSAAMTLPGGRITTIQPYQF